MLIGDENVVQKCITCNQLKSEPAQWWEFVSLQCQQCDHPITACVPATTKYGEPF